MVERAPIVRVALPICIVANALFVVFYMNTPQPNHDVWHAMALARESLKLGYVPTTDLYSYAPTVAPVVHHEWLAGVVALATFTAAGLNGFALLWLGLTAAMWVACIVGLRGTRVSVGIGAAALMTPFIMYSQYQPCIAQSYSSLMTAVTILIVQADMRARHRRWLMLCLPISVLWVNLHAGAVLGVAILAVYSVERRVTGRAWSAQAATAIAMAGAFAVSPFGLSYYSYLARALTMPRPEIGQWRPFWFLDPSLWSWLFVASVFVLAWTIRRRGTFTGSLITVALAILAARASKNLPFYGIAWLVFVARHVAVPAISQRIALAGGVLSAAAIPLLSVGIWHTAPWHVVLPSDIKTSQGSLALPVYAADYLQRTGFRGNVMTFFRHGAYLSWRLYPKVKVSCDARYEAAYPPRDVSANFEAYLRRPESFQAEIARLPQTDLILIDRRMAAKKAIDLLRGWHSVYNDEIFTLLGRDTLRASLAHQ